MVRNCLALIVVGFTFAGNNAADEPPAVKVGDKAPDFVVTGIDGGTFRLSDKLAGGKKNVCLMFSRANW